MEMNKMKWKPPQSTGAAMAVSQLICAAACDDRSLKQFWANLSFFKLV